MQSCKVPSIDLSHLSLSLTESEQQHEKQCGKMEWILNIQFLPFLSLATVSVHETLVETP